MFEKFEELMTSYPNHAWFGSYPPADFDIINFNLSTNYRLSSKHHGRYDVLWFLDHFLEDMPAWPLVFDECIRCLKKQGFLLLKYRRHQGFISKFTEYLNKTKHISVKNSKKFNFSTTPDDFILYEIMRNNYEIYEDKNWSIYLNIEDKLKNEEIKNIFYKLQRIGEIEFFDKDEIGNDYLVFAKKAKYENLLILNNAYLPDNNFFTCFDEYGYDFDYLAFRVESFQLENLGVFYGCSNMSKLKKSLEPFLNFDNYMPLQWVGFGPIAIKRSVFLNVSQPIDVPSEMGIGLSYNSRAILPRYQFLSAFKTNISPVEMICQSTEMLQTALEAIAWNINEMPPKPSWKRRVLAATFKLSPRSYMFLRRCYLKFREKWI